uniref:MTMR6-9 GRAM domain-containing protein n=1 Tax=Coturnix japonica TaxID=93934 RepID=A0A8C2SR45_COTJA
MEFAELIKTPRADNAVLHRPFYPTVEGTLCLTGHHLIFSSRRQDNEEELWLLHSNIDSIEKRLCPVSPLTKKRKDPAVVAIKIKAFSPWLNYLALVKFASLALISPRNAVSWPEGGEEQSET